MPVGPGWDQSPVEQNPWKPFSNFMWTTLLWFLGECLENFLKQLLQLAQVGPGLAAQLPDKQVFF